MQLIKSLVQLFTNSSKELADAAMEPQRTSKPLQPNWQQEIDELMQAKMRHHRHAMRLESQIDQVELELAALKQQAQNSPVQRQQEYADLAADQLIRLQNLTQSLGQEQLHIKQIDQEVQNLHFARQQLQREQAMLRTQQALVQATRVASQEGSLGQARVKLARHREKLAYDQALIEARKEVQDQLSAEFERAGLGQKDQLAAQWLKDLEARHG